MAPLMFLGIVLLVDDDDMMQWRIAGCDAAYDRAHTKAGHAPQTSPEAR